MEATSKSLCTEDEKILASCDFNRKKISFCADADGKSIHYRYGTSLSTELQVQFTSRKPLSRWVDAATYTTYLGFRQGKYIYLFGIPEERPNANAFLDIYKDNILIKSMSCIGNSLGEKALASGAIRDVDDSVVRGNYFLFPLN